MLRQQQQQRLEYQQRRAAEAAAWEEAVSDLLLGWMGLEKSSEEDNEVRKDDKVEKVAAADVASTPSALGDSPAEAPTSSIKYVVRMYDANAGGWVVREFNVTPNGTEASTATAPTNSNQQLDTANKETIASVPVIPDEERSVASASSKGSKVSEVTVEDVEDEENEDEDY